MSKQMDKIEDYGLSVNDLDVSPFESMEMLHLRSKIERVFNELTNEERTKLFQYDVILVKNAKEMAEHLSEIYSFSMSTEPISLWWWHLKVARGEITFPTGATCDVLP